MTIYFLSVLVSLGGATFHWLKRYMREQTSRNLWQYLIDFKTYSLMSLGAVLASVGTVLSIVPDPDFSNPAFISHLLLGGYTIDSVVNKDEDS